jgi:hypothetical protein
MNDETPNLPPNSLSLHWLVKVGPLHAGELRCVIYNVRLHAPDPVAVPQCEYAIHQACASTLFGKLGVATISQCCPHFMRDWWVAPPPVELEVVNLQPPELAVGCHMCDPTATTKEYGDFVEIGCNGRHNFHINCVKDYWIFIRDDRDIDAENLETWENMAYPKCSMFKTAYNFATSMLTL